MSASLQNTNSPYIRQGSQLVGMCMSVAPLHRKRESEFVTEYSSNDCRSSRKHIPGFVVSARFMLNIVAY